MTVGAQALASPQPSVGAAVPIFVDREAAHHVVLRRDVVARKRLAEHVRVLAVCAARRKS